jgi:hypothetical protein
LAFEQSNDNAQRKSAGTKSRDCRLRAHFTEISLPCLVTAEHFRANDYLAMGCWILSILSGIIIVNGQEKWSDAVYA